MADHANYEVHFRADGGLDYIKINLKCIRHADRGQTVIFHICHIWPARFDRVRIKKDGKESPDLFGDAEVKFGARCTIQGTAPNGEYTFTPIPIREEREAEHANGLYESTPFATKLGDPPSTGTIKVGS